jgi:hypothetical protein
MHQHTPCMGAAFCTVPYYTPARRLSHAPHTVSLPPPETYALTPSRSRNHPFADMYLLPLAIVVGHPSLTARDLAVGILLPTTLGNWFGGAVCVPTFYAFVYGTPNKTLTEWAARKRRAFLQGRAGTGTRGCGRIPQLGARGGLRPALGLVPSLAAS